ncbi:MAG TPA: ScyD/ScyE family protein [Thermomicrobiales bacterium]
MLTKRSRMGLFGVLVIALLLLPIGVLAQEATPAAGGAPPLPEPSANVSVFATGLDNPRGLKFGPDGALYVAEGGKGGTDSTEGQCTQVVPPVGPYTGGKTARISKLDAAGQRTTVADGLPSNQTAPAVGSQVSGIADIAWVGETMYALLAGGGCSHGHPNDPNGVLRVNADGTTELIADLSAFVKAHPVAKPNPGDFEPDEGAYAMIERDGALYVVHPNHGAVEKVTPEGAITRVVDVSASEGHVVPTAIALGPDGNFYVGTLLTFPVAAGAAKIYRLTPDGQLSTYAEGLTAVLGLAFDAQGRLYVLETSGAGSPDAPIVPGSGRVVRLTDDGGLEAMATGLVFPTAMTFGADGALYVSNYGFLFPPGAGQVVRIGVAAPLPGQPAGSPAAGASS